jgi:hypothetical protein
VVAPTLDLVYGTEAPPEAKPRRKRRLSKRERRADDAPAPTSLFESPWPPAPQAVEPMLDLTAAEPENIFTSPPRAANAASIVEPDIDLTAEAAPHETDAPEEPARDVVVPEVVVPEVVVPEVVVPEIVELVQESTPELRNGSGNGRGVEVVPEDRPLVTPVEVVDAPEPVAPPPVELPAQTRAVRVKTVRVNGKKRWVVDVLVRQEDEKPKRR